MKVEETWQRGYSGEGIVIAVVDDGMETDQPDLVNNMVCLFFDSTNHTHAFTMFSVCTQTWIL